jgi:hypothetical protein
MSTHEPRALTAALQSPAFVTRGGGLAMHTANRHVERYAPEVGDPAANRIRPLRNLGFVDRLVSPWIESAQRSASLRMFSQAQTQGVTERNAASVSWLFPRPWYQDELDWMAAARTVGAQTAVEQSAAPNMFTTRGTYVTPAQTTRTAQLALPTQLHEYVAPSLSVAKPDVQATAEAYSPLVPFAATQAAHVMARAIAPLASAAPSMSPGLRAVLTQVLQRAAQPVEVAPTRASFVAPELVTPPAPRPDAKASEGEELADQYAEQHARIAELQRMARAAAEREHAARTAPSAESTAAVRAAEARAIEQRQADVQRRLADAGAQRPGEPSADRQAQIAAERARIEERIQQKLAEQRRQHDVVRLHEQSREAAARDARSAALAPATASTSEPTARPENRVAQEIAAAVAALPAELSAMVAANISQRPERAAAAIAELSDALRTVELIARTSAAGGTIESTRGPRVLMPAGLGGLVATVERTLPRAERAPMLPVADAPHARELRMPALPFISAPRQGAPAPTSALAAATASAPAALQHVAWSDRWLARFTGARPQSLDVLAVAASPEARYASLAASVAPSVYVSPLFEDRSRQAQQPSGETGFAVGFTGETNPALASLAARHAEPLPTLRGAQPAQPVVRFDDNAETPDEMFAAIAMAASRTRASAQLPVMPGAVPAQPAIEPDRLVARDTFADVVAHAVPAAPGAGLAAQLASSPFAPALRHLVPLGSAPTFDVRALFGAGLSMTYLSGLLDAATHEVTISHSGPAAFTPFATSLDAGEPIARSVADVDMPVIAPVGDVEAAETQAAQAGEAAATLTTLRSALLSFDVETLAGEAGTQTRVAAPTVTAASAPLASSMIESLTLPMLADTAAPTATSHAAPGMLGERMHSWSVAQERSTADLAFDFLSPELVLAARVYGLGPAEAAQAARLAVAGPGQLAAMAGAVDRTFVQAMAIQAERRGERVVSAFPVAAGDTGAAPGVRAGESAAATPATFAPATTSFGIERRMPRGAFLWPAGTTAAMGLHAASPDREQASVAALELLAAQSVAELGTYAALAGEPTAAATDSMTSAVTAASDPETIARTMVPAARREKFEALYLALSQSPAGRAWSPAARAARALALAGRGDETVTARDRATAAWDVLPVVYGMSDDEPALSTGDSAARAMRRRDELRAIDPVLVDMRPGLGGLSSRAGEALGAYVAPAAAPAPASASSSASSRDVGAVLRAPTAAPELVQTGGRHGGGEVEIPPWFEEAAKKMFGERSSVSDGISIAELTLVTTAPPQQVAASTRASGGHAPVAQGPAAQVVAEKETVDIEKLANDVYREVLVLMDLARARNGEPYL